MRLTWDVQHDLLRALEPVGNSVVYHDEESREPEREAIRHGMDPRSLFLRRFRVYSEISHGATSSLTLRGGVAPSLFQNIFESVAGGERGIRSKAMLDPGRTQG